MKLLTSFILLFIVHSNLVAQVFEDSTRFDLHVNLTPGDRYSYSISSKQSVIQEILGETIEINQEFVSDYKYLVESNENNTIKIKATYEAIELLVDSPEDQIEYRSSDEDHDGRFSMLNNLIGKSFHIFMNSNGKVYRVTGLEELTKDLNLNKYAQELLNDSSMLRLLNMDIYPDDAVFMGGNWNKVNLMNIANLKLTSDLVYTLEGTSEDLVWLNVDGKISGSGTRDNFDMELSGSQTGTIETDLKSGMISSGDTRMEVEAVIKSLDLEVPVKVFSETKVTSKKL